MRAIALDDSQGEGHTLLGLLKAHYEFARPGAEKEYRRRLELSPNNPYAHMFYSNNYLSPLAAMKKETKTRLLWGEDPKNALQKEVALRKALKEGGSQGHWKNVLELLQTTENPPEAYQGPYHTVAKALG